MIKRKHVQKNLAQNNIACKFQNEYYLIDLPVDSTLKYDPVGPYRLDSAKSPHIRIDSNIEICHENDNQTQYHITIYLEHQTNRNKHTLHIYYNIKDNVINIPVLHVEPLHQMLSADKHEKHDEGFISLANRLKESTISHIRGLQQEINNQFKTKCNALEEKIASVTNDRLNALDLETYEQSKREEITLIANFIELVKAWARFDKIDKFENDPINQSKLLQERGEKLAKETFQDFLSNKKLQSNTPFQREPIATETEAKQEKQSPIQPMQNKISNHSHNRKKATKKEQTRSCS